MADCGCIKENYDFTLKSMDSKTLVYQDMSTWMEGAEFSTPDKYSVSVQMPGKTTGELLDLSIFSQSAIRSENFGSSSHALPDGIYCFTLSNCGTTFTRTKAVLYSLECCLQSAKAAMKDDKDLEKIIKMEFYLDSIRINADLGKVQKAQEYFDLAKKELSNLNCNCK